MDRTEPGLRVRNNPSFERDFAAAPETMTLSIARRCGFHLSEARNYDAGRFIGTRWYWCVDASGTTDNAPYKLGLGLDLNAHPGFESELAAARHALKTLAEQLMVLAGGHDDGR